MKFTKQEQSLIKLAAAHMAPQMLKKATLQDKLAEYGIGMNKKAADLPGYMKAVNPLTGMPNAAAARRALMGGALAGSTVGSVLRGARPQQSQSADAARGAINELKTNGWPAIGAGAGFRKELQEEQKGSYGTALFDLLARMGSGGKYQSLDDTLGKLSEVGVYGEGRSNSTGLMSSNGRIHPRHLAPSSRTTGAK